jgi:hypothetical protein
MDPISVGLGLAGLGMQLFGGLGQASVSKQQAGISAEVATISGQVAGDEQKIEAQRQQQMQLEAGRLQLQNFRNVQQAKAQGLAAATAGGAQFGSGLAGAQAGATDQGLYNSLGISQNLAIGQNIFGINSDISQKRIQMAGLQSQSALLGGQAATDQGYQSLGGALIKAGPTIGAFGKNIAGGGGLFGGGGASGSF